jgi:hypothetical protein
MKKVNSVQRERKSAIKVKLRIGGVEKDLSDFTERHTRDKSTKISIVDQHKMDASTPSLQVDPYLT